MLDEIVNHDNNKQKEKVRGEVVRRELKRFYEATKSIISMTLWGCAEWGCRVALHVGPLRQAIRLLCCRRPKRKKNRHVQ